MSADATTPEHAASDDPVAPAAPSGLPALGEAPVCERCDARGLCRRDHWTLDAVT